MEACIRLVRRSQAEMMLALLNDDAVATPFAIAADASLLRCYVLLGGDGGTWNPPRVSVDNRSLGFGQC